MQIDPAQGIILSGVPRWYSIEEIQMSDISYSEKRRRRVKRLKRMIVIAFFTVVTIPIALCIYLGCTLYGVTNDLAEITSQYEAQLTITDDLQRKLEEEKMARVAAEAESGEAAVDLNIMPAEPASTVDDDAEAMPEEEDGIKKVYLTFDDGPSIYTEEILDILDQYDAKATFFVTGEAAVEHPDRYKMIVDRGHSIGMHSYSHKYGEVYRNKDNFVRDFNKIRDFLTEATGVTPVIYRFPGGSSNTVSATDMDELCEYLNENGIHYFDWNVSSGDATSQTLSRDRIVANCLAGIYSHDDSVVLLHDTSAKYTTVAALPVILEQLKGLENIEVCAITASTPVVQHREIKESE